MAVICAVFGDVRGDGQDSAFSERAALAYYESSDDDEDDSDDDKDVSMDSGEAAQHEWDVPRPRNWKKPFYQMDAIERITEHIAFGIVVTLTILANTVTMGMVYHDMPESTHHFIENCELLFTSIYVLEMLLKIVGLGMGRYMSNNWNRMDAFVNIISLASLLASSPEPSATAPRMLRMFRIARATRVARLLERFASMRRLIRAVSESTTAIVNLYVFLIFSLFVVTLFGMHMLGDLKEYETVGLQWVDEGTGKANTIPRTTFTDFLMSFSSSFLMMTGDRWKATMYTYM